MRKLIGEWKNLIFSQDALITLIIFQFEVFYGTSDFTSFTEAPQNKWDKTWYVTEAFTYALFASYFAQTSKGKNYVAAWVMLAIFLTIRLVWDIYAVRKGWDVNMKIIMAILFYTISTICFFTILLPYLKKICQLLLQSGKLLGCLVRSFWEAVILWLSR